MAGSLITLGTQSLGGAASAAWANQVKANFDTLNAERGAWAAYTPTWAATAAPALGNGTLLGAYTTIDKTTMYRIELTIGSTTTFGTGQWRFGLPSTPVSVYWRFDANALDVSANAYYAVSAMWLNAGGYLVMWAPATTAGTSDRAVTGTAPFTWAVGDVLTITGSYEAV